MLQWTILHLLRRTIFLVLTSIIAGPWQVMLRQTDNSYACVAESATRFTLGEVSTVFLNQNPHCSIFPRYHHLLGLTFIYLKTKKLTLACICRPRKNY